MKGCKKKKNKVDISVIIRHSNETLQTLNGHKEMAINCLKTQQSNKTEINLVSQGTV